MTRVLVADDSRFMRRVIAHTIESAGITSIFQASNGKEALELFQAEEFDLVLADLKMAQHGGLDLISAIRRCSPLVPIWVISASKELCGEALQAGANDFIPKPFDVFVLSEKIKNLLGATTKVRPRENSSRNHNSRHPNRTREATLDRSLFTSNETREELRKAVMLNAERNRAPLAPAGGRRGEGSTVSLARQIRCPQPLKSWTTSLGERGARLTSKLKLTRH